jgi:Fur family transcriptional regulator, ferric uptake regulator
MILILKIGLIYRRMAERGDSTLEGVDRYLRAAGLRPTRGRVAVLDELSREADDATAQAIHRRLAVRPKPVGLATVYRALHDLAAAGVIDALPHGAETCYRLCGAGHHHHLVCSECHRVVELTDCRLGGWLARASAAEGFLVTDHTLEAVGLCASCRS